MKAFIIHTPHKKSVEYAQKALTSFEQYNGWDVELFMGITVETLPDFENKYPLKTKQPSRAAGFYLQRKQNNMYYVKKSCSMNHYRLFKLCIELNEPIAIIEHDAHCIGDWVCPTFKDILIMNIDSAIKRDSSKYIWHLNTKATEEGVHNVKINGLIYRHDPKINGATMMPGTAAYAITPEGAEKMIEVYENIGWEQSDFIINTAYVNIQTIVPELFTFKLENLSTSHGKNLK